MKIQQVLGLCLWFFSYLAWGYNSTYNLIQWEARGNDTSYCIDLTDGNWNIYPDFQAIACGEYLYEFSPDAFVQERYNLSAEQLIGLTFYWRVWSASGYGGNGFEGKVTVGDDCGLPYVSNQIRLRWGCRFQDTHYCLDLFDASWQPIQTPLICGDNLHEYFPANLRELDLPTGTYHWKVWSPHAYNYEGPQRFFEGEFVYNADLVGTGNAEFNRQQTERLYGVWKFTYTIISDFSDTYTLSGISESESVIGDFLISGTDTYGNEDVVAAYNSSIELFTLIDAINYSTEAKFYMFSFDENDNNKVYGVYYRIELTTLELKSNAYKMTGVRTIGGQNPPW
jgi:hypothetical protein